MKIGDVVKVKSIQSPKMIVNEIRKPTQEAKLIHCLWFDADDRIHEKWIHEDILEKVE